MKDAMTSASASHPGLVRQNNEDCLHTDDTLGIYLLADGIGGHNAGEVASALAVETAYAILRSNIGLTNADGYFELIEHALLAAHWEVSAKAQSSSSYMRMGTTLVIAVIRDNKAYIVHAGDSRCYLLQKDSRHHPAPLSEVDASTLQRLTHDHTVGDLLLASGIAMSQIPKKQFHTLTQSIGCGNPPAPDFKVIDLTQGDLLLLCSDGLTDMLTDAEIMAILEQKNSTLDTLADELVTAANAHGGKDNVSVVLVKFPT
jgi:protein phosphatase